MKSEAEFTKLISETYRSLLTFIRYLGLPTDEVDDMAQEVYIKAFRAMEKFDKTRSFKSWVFSIAKNSYIDWTRRQKTKRKYFSLELSEKFNMGFETKSQKKLDVEKILNNLTDEERVLIELRFFQKFKFKEIAEFTGNTENSVKMKVRRILTKMKSGLTRKEYANEL